MPRHKKPYSELFKTKHVDFVPQKLIFLTVLVNILNERKHSR